MSELKTWPTAYGPIVQRKIYANLFTEVIRQNKCVLCGACMATCPTNAIIIINETPRLTGVCIKCGYCYYSCPSTTDDMFKGFEYDRNRVEKRIFGEVRKEDFGVYRKIYVAEPTEDSNATLEEGLIRRLMIFGLDRSYFDVVGFGGYGDYVTKHLLMSPRGKWEAAALIASSSNELENVRLKPLTPALTYNAVRGALEELSNGFFYGSEPIRVALFGPPQHIRSVWRMRFSWSEHRKLSRTIVFTISHFERPYYSYKELRNILMTDDVDIDTIEDWVFEDDGISFLIDGKWRKYSYDVLSPAIYKGFNLIKDPTGEYADVSIGRIMNIDGIVVITRSEEGERFVEEAVNEGILKPKDIDVDKIVSGLKSLYK